VRRSIKSLSIASFRSLWTSWIQVGGRFALSDSLRGLRGGIGGGWSSLSCSLSLFWLSSLAAAAVAVPLSLSLEASSFELGFVIGLMMGTIRAVGLLMGTMCAVSIKESDSGSSA
jgi:hypothetical protein